MYQYALAVKDRHGSFALPRSAGVSDVTNPNVQLEGTRRFLPRRPSKRLLAKAVPVRV